MDSINEKLIEAASAGDVDGVRSLLENGADVHVWNDFALRWAARKGHAEIVKLLLENGADVHAKDDYALCWAARNGHLEVVKFLKEYLETNKMKTIYKSIGPRDSVPHFPARSEGRVEREERAMWTCRVCGVGLQYNYDGHFELCLEHKDGGEGRDILTKKALDTLATNKKRYRDDYESYQEIHSDDEVVCPHCFYIYNDCLWEYVDMSDGSETVITCDHCGELFVVHTTIITTFTSSKVTEKGE